jgi:DNA polymerase elongation subunit (family B)
MTDRLIKERMAKGDSFAAAWEGLFASLEYTAVMEQQPGTEITIEWESGGETVHSGAEIWHMIFDSNRPWILTANGTILTYEKKGIIPGLLERWYSERKDMQAKKKQATDAKEIAFWDKRQLVKKINLNSLYGAILNAGCRFFDKRIGQSTTLTGRSIAKHMDAYINECITGEYDHVGKAIIYGDTDSCYFSAWSVLEKEVKEGRMEWSKETAIALGYVTAEEFDAWVIPVEMCGEIK